MKLRCNLFYSTSAELRKNIYYLLSNIYLFLKVRSTYAHQLPQFLSNFLRTTVLVHVINFCLLSSVLSVLYLCHLSSFTSLLLTADGLAESASAGGRFLLKGTSSSPPSPSAYGGSTGHWWVFRFNTVVFVIYTFEYKASVVFVRWY